MAPLTKSSTIQLVRSPIETKPLGACRVNRFGGGEAGGVSILQSVDRVPHVLNAQYNTINKLNYYYYGQCMNKHYARLPV